MIALFWLWTAVAWWSGVPLIMALASASTARAGQEGGVIIDEQVTVRFEELLAEEDEVDSGESFVDVVRN